MKKQVYLHIGTHKTGSTSIQQFLLDHTEFLKQNGIAFYRGQFEMSNHSEVYLAALRYERDSFAKQGVCKHVRCDAAFTQQVTERVQNFLQTCNEPRALFTAEGLSLLRHDDEIERLRAILNSANADTTIILYLRDKEAFLRSYTNQLYKVKGRQAATDYWSGLYVEPDTWLTDYDALIATYQKGFGSESVFVVDYDLEMRIAGNVIPSFLNVLGVDGSHKLDTSVYFRNATRGSSLHSQTKRLSHRARRAWQRWFHHRAA